MLDENPWAYSFLASLEFSKIREVAAKKQMIKIFTKIATNNTFLLHHIKLSSSSQKLSMSKQPYIELVLKNEAILPHQWFLRPVSIIWGKQIVGFVHIILTIKPTTQQRYRVIPWAMNQSLIMDPNVISQESFLHTSLSHVYTSSPKKNLIYPFDPQVIFRFVNISQFLGKYTIIPRSQIP